MNSLFPLIHSVKIFDDDGIKSDELCVEKEDPFDL